MDQGEHERGDTEEDGNRHEQAPCQIAQHAVIVPVRDSPRNLPLENSRVPLQSPA
jgi:hypothetical protein